MQALLRATAIESLKVVRLAFELERHNRRHLSVVGDLNAIVPREEEAASNRFDLKDSVVDREGGSGHRQGHPCIPTQARAVLRVGAQLAWGNFLRLQNRLDIKVQGWTDIHARDLAQRPKRMAVRHQGAEL